MPEGRDAEAEPLIEPLDEEPEDGAMPPGVGLVEPDAALPVVPVDDDEEPVAVRGRMLLVASSQHCVLEPAAPADGGDDGDVVVPELWA